jgi:putative ABC transport system ATP-binding protein
MIQLNNINKSYSLGSHTVHAVKDVNLLIEKGEFTAIVGPSGSGKSTLMNIIGCIDTPDSGSVMYDETPIDYSSLTHLSAFRAGKLGFIFQSFNLIPVLSAYENIEYPLLLNGLGRKERKKRIEEIADKVGLAQFLAHKPAELSGGQKQRVAIARSLINQPAVVLADEPTANLDEETSHTIISLMKELNKNNTTTFLITTHDPLVRLYTDREILLKDGRVIKNEMEVAS